MGTSVSNSYAFVQAADKVWLLLQQAYEGNLSTPNIEALISSLTSLYTMLNSAQPDGNDTKAYNIYNDFAWVTPIGLSISSLCSNAAAFSYLTGNIVPLLTKQPGVGFSKLFNDLHSVGSCYQDTCSWQIQCALMGDGTSNYQNKTGLLSALQAYNANYSNSELLNSTLVGVATAINYFNTLTVNDGYLSALKSFLGQNTINGSPNSDLITFSNNLVAAPTSVSALKGMQFGLNLVNEDSVSGGNLLALLGTSMRSGANVLYEEFSGFSCPSGCAAPVTVNGTALCPCTGLCDWYNSANCTLP